MNGIRNQSFLESIPIKSFKHCECISLRN
jgi:hypothetical protein